MHKICEYDDVFQLDKPPITSCDVEGGTIRECLQNRFDGFDEFTNTPAIVCLNEVVKLRETWDYEIPEGSTIEVRYLPAFVAIPIAAAAGMAAASVAAAAGVISMTTAMLITVGLTLVSLAATFLFMPKPKSPDALKSADPVYTLSGQQNTIRPMEPIEVPYGKNIIFPTLAARPYVFWSFEGVGEELHSIQTLYQLFCLGKGEFDIHEFYIEDTPIKFFGGSVVINREGPSNPYIFPNPDIKIDVIHPGQAYPVKNTQFGVSSNGSLIPPIPTFFNANVYVAGEVGGIDLLAPNHHNFAVMGPYVTVPAYERTQFLAIDVSYPRGGVGKDGGFWIHTRWEAQEIDDRGYPIGGWFVVKVHSDWFDNWPSAITKTLYVQLERPMRIQMRGQRTSNYNQEDPANHVAWGGLRCWLYKDFDEHYFGDVTLISVVIRSNTQINDHTKTRFNVECTRRTPSIVAESGLGTSIGLGTRSICAAFADVLTANYGAGLTELEPVPSQQGAYQLRHLDLPTLRKLESEFLAEGRYFDFVFKQGITVWDALTTIARAGRSVPIISGNKVSMVRDHPKVFPTAIFNADNIVKGSLSWEVSKPSIGDFDSVEVTYCNPETGLQETVKAYIEGEGLNPDKIDLTCLKDRDIAYREALFVYQQNRYIRQKIKFQTGLEGLIPSFGDLISVAFPAFTTSTGGWVVSEQTSNIAGYRRFQMSEPYDWSVLSTTPIMFIRRDDGLSAGPYACKKPDDVADEESLRFLIDVEIQPSVDFVSEPGREKIFFQLGETYTFFKKCTLLSSRPSEDEVVDIECANYDERIYDYDSALAPDTEGPPITEESPRYPTRLMLTSLDDTFALFTWLPVNNVTEYGVKFLIDDSTVYESTTSATFHRARLRDLPRLTNVDLQVVSKRGSITGAETLWRGNITTDLIAPQLVTYKLSRRGVEFAWSNIQAAWGYRVIPAIWDRTTAGGYLYLNGLVSQFQGGIFSKELKDDMQRYFPDLLYPRLATYRVMTLAYDRDQNRSLYSTIDVLIEAPDAPRLNPPSWIRMDPTEHYVRYTLRWLPPHSGAAEHSTLAYRVYWKEGEEPEIIPENLIYEGPRTETQRTVDLVDYKHPDLYWLVVSTDGWSEEDLKATEAVKIPAYDGTPYEPDSGGG